MFLFGSKKSPQELLKENQRTISRAIREIDRERLSLETQEKNYLAMAKRAASAGHISSVKIMVKDAVRIRSQINKFFELRTQLQAVSLRLQTLRSTQTIATVMGGVTKAIKAANKKTDLDVLSKILKDFEQQNAIMGIKEDALDCTLDSMVVEQMVDVSSEEEHSEQAVDELMRKILNEAGVTINAPTASMSMLEPSASIMNTRQPSSANMMLASDTVAPSSKDAELEARLNRLKDK